jgi:iron donor protein CyaY
MALRWKIGGLVSEQVSDARFRDLADKAIRDLEKAFARLSERYEIDVEVEGGVLNIEFEEGEPGRFIVSPNSSARQLWVSARVSSYKFDWSEESKEFILSATGESLRTVMSTLTREQLGEDSVEL